MIAWLPLSPPYDGYEDEDDEALMALVLPTTLHAAADAQVPQLAVAEFDPNQPRAPKGTSIGGQWTTGGHGEMVDTGVVQPQPFYLDTKQIVTEEGAEREFKRSIRMQYPEGLPIFHETTVELGEKIAKEGMQPDMFGTVGQTSQFVVTPDKAVVFIRLTPRESAQVTPDMRYDPANPWRDLLMEHKGVMNADLSLNNDFIPPNRVQVSIRKGGRWRVLILDANGALKEDEDEA